MDHTSSSLPLKKRPLRNDFTCIEDLATSHVESLICSDTEISSSGRSSSASSIELEKEAPLVHHHRHFSPPLSHALYACATSPFTLICHPSELERARNRYINIEGPRECFFSSTSLFTTMPYTEARSKDEHGTSKELPLTSSSLTLSSSSSSHSSSLSSLGKSEIDHKFNCTDGTTVVASNVPSSHHHHHHHHHHQAFNNHSSSLVYCNSCDKIFAGRAKYQAHIRRHNSKLTGRYQCTDCGKRFVQRSSLVTHLRIHTGERPYKCAFRTCSESFSDFSTYTKHIRTHTGEKPYSCPICFRAFSQSGNMHRHLKGVHKQIGHSTGTNLITLKSG